MSFDHTLAPPARPSFGRTLSVVSDDPIMKEYNDLYERFSAILGRLERRPGIVQDELKPFRDSLNEYSRFFKVKDAMELYEKLMDKYFNTTLSCKFEAQGVWYRHDHDDQDPGAAAAAICVS